MIYGVIRYINERERWEFCLYAANRQLQHRQVFGFRHLATKAARKLVEQVPSVTHVEVIARNGEEVMQIRRKRKTPEKT